MSETPLGITVDEQTSITVIRVVGDIPASQAGVLEDTVLPLLGGPGTDIEVDLSGVTFLSSTGLSVLVQLVRRAKQQKRALRYCRPSAHIERMLRIANLPIAG
jgi:anti-sigma B factor antagonist